MDEYDEGCLAQAEKEVAAIRDAALKKVQKTHPEITRVIDRRTVDDYCEKVWDYPGKWYYMGVRIPAGFHSEEALTDAIAADTLQYFANGGASSPGFSGKKAVAAVIVYYSRHHGNTKKLLDAITAADKTVSLIDVTKHPNADLSGFDRIGFASGIYYSKFAEPLLTFAQAHLPENKDVFYIYTHGAPVGGFLTGIRAIAAQKHCRELGKYDCLGFDTVGPFRFVGGIAKGHPNEKDVAGAVKFYQNL